MKLILACACGIGSFHLTGTPSAVLQEAAVAVDGREPIDAAEIFDHIRDIIDPEHPYSLEQLNVVEEELISVDDTAGHVK